MRKDGNHKGDVIYKRWSFSLFGGLGKKSDSLTEEAKNFRDDYWHRVLESLQVSYRKLCVFQLGQFCGITSLVL